MKNIADLIDISGFLNKRKNAAGYRVTAYSDTGAKLWLCESTPCTAFIGPYSFYAYTDNETQPFLFPTKKEAEQAGKIVQGITNERMKRWAAELVQDVKVERVDNERI